MPDFVPDVDGCAGCFTAPLEIFNGLGDLMSGGGGSGSNGEFTRRDGIGLSLIFLFISMLGFGAVAVHQEASKGIETVTGTVKQVTNKGRNTVLVLIEAENGDETKAFECEEGIKPEEGVPYEFVLVGTPFGPFREHQSVIKWKRLDNPDKGIFGLFGPKMAADARPPSDMSGLMIVCGAIAGLALVVLLTLVIVARVRD